MVYNSFLFIVVFPVIFFLYYLIPARLKNWRNVFLLITSYALYISWKPICVFILLGVTLITYYGGLIIEKQGDDNKRKTRILWVFSLLSLLPLIIFKYYNFLNSSIADILTLIGIQFHIAGLNWAIPVGISFFTFQSVGYIFDVYNRRIKAEYNFLEYALFISFFPSILSGPINKASLVLPQIKNLRAYFDYDKAVEGLKYLLWGMFMKVVVADRVALYVDMVFPSYNSYSGLTCFVASLFYTIQIYADFAGYSLMALGVGKVLGFELTENFRRPYFAVSVTDFWRRWHISLSTWLKDYVYIPLGGSRCSKLRNYWNIFVTFLVSGIWHGANWTFIVWGIWHGLFQIIEKAIGQQKCEYGWFGRALKILITFLLVNFAWIFFRMPSIEDACLFIQRIFDFNLPITLEVIPNLPFTIGGLLILLFKDLRDECFSDRFSLLNNKNRMIRWISYIVILVIIVTSGVLGSDQFIYANF